jgi:hypothetical protein
MEASLKVSAKEAEEFYDEGFRIKDPDGNIYYHHESHNIINESGAFSSRSTPPDFDSFPNGWIILPSEE